jgi:two-component system C4-dicarboxylate transport sensor histidine kinase DctB
VDVCYLLDAKGTGVASSNRREPVSFVGDNYGFRPYFKEAMQGRSFRYFALGNTSRLRGFYASAPVTDGAGKVVGVAVIKKNLDALEEEMRLMPYAFFVSPEGVVFLAGRSELLFNSLWTVDQAARYELLKSNQFGPLDFNPLWPVPPADGELVYLKGEEFYLSRLMCGADGWSLVALTPTRTVLITRFYGVFITLVLCLLAAGLLVIYAQSDTRRAEELELLRVREEKRSLQALLPVCAACRKPRDDKEYRAKLDAYIGSHMKASSSQCLCPDCAKKVYSPGRG